MRHLAFVRYSSYGASASDLYIIGLSGDLVPQGKPERLTAFNGRVTSPVWTPDGRTTLFTRREGAGSHSLWRVNLTGNRQIEPLPIAADSSSSMTLSHSGTKIVYTRESSNLNIWAVDLNSAATNRAGRTRPLIASTSEEDNPQFSPDGQHIAYQSSRSGKTEVWVCDRDGSNSRQLTNMAAVISGFARWSPDGKKVVFHSRPNGSASLYVIDAAGGTPKRLTSETGNDISPSWSHDGKWIYFASRRTGELCIWKMPAGGGPALQLTELSGFSPLESKDGQYLYYTTLPRLALRRLPLSGGADKEILSGVAGAGSSYALAANGIYFIRVASGRRKQELSFFSFATGEIKKILALPGRVSLGLALSPDARMILFSQIDQQDSDLMLVDRFR
jgi:Tol biopolymer transport system component